MKRNSVRLQRIIFSGSLIFFFFSGLPVFGGDVLTEVLREKGIISKEDWDRIETDRNGVRKWGQA